MLDKEPSELGGSYGDVSEFDIAQYMSRVIHNDIVMAGCTSWCYWTAMSVERYDQKNRFELIKTTPSGGNYSNDFTVAAMSMPRTISGYWEITAASFARATSASV